MSASSRPTGASATPFEPPTPSTPPKPPTPTPPTRSTPPEPPTPSAPTAVTPPTAPGRLSPWRAIVGFGIVSLTADMVYEGARSITGPLLANLGASALLVGVVTGVGEAAALVLRLVFGRAADRSSRYWPMTITGYALTAVSVPLLAITPFLGAAGLAVACALILTERTGKAVRSPAKSTLLAHVATGVGIGRAFGVHKALDQTGSFTGPLLVAGLVALTGAIWPAMAALALPGAAAMAILVWMRRRIGEPADDVPAPNTDVTPAPNSNDVPAPNTDVTPAPHPHVTPAPNGNDVPAPHTDDVPAPHAHVTPAPRPESAPARRTFLPRTFWLFAASSGAATAGLVTFGVISFHLAHEQVVALSAIPVVYAAGMAMEAVAALVTGFGYDRIRGKVLYVLPFLAAAVPWLAFTDRVGLALLGVLIWGAANGIQDSTVKALVADLVPPGRRATAYGIFAAIQGAGAVAGGTLAGALYARSIPLLGAIIAAIEAVALALYVATLRLSPR